MDTAYISNALELQALAKWEHDSVKINIMNQRIIEEHMYWRAGRTVLNDKIHQEREILFGNKYNLRGYDYYKGGLYHIIGKTAQNPSQSQLVSDFDWRYRHKSDDPESPYYNFASPPGLNGYPLGWITPFQCPQIGNTCYAFAAIYFCEAMANLYFNNNVGPGSNPCQHQINLDLSQEQIIVCQNLASSCFTPGYNYATLYVPWMCSNYIVDESCFPFQCPPPFGPPCPTWTNPTDEIRLGGASSLQSTMNEDYLKSILIEYGPISCNVMNYVAGSNLSHQMLLVGFSLPVVGDTVYYGDGNEDPPIVLDEYYNSITTWWFKDSYQNKFQPVEGDITSTINTQYIISDNSWYSYGLIDRPLFPTPIICSDEDGDGYYWWGLHWKDEGGQIVQVSPQECNCPEGVNIDEEDCNDWDKYSGPYNPNYSCIWNPCVTVPNDPLIINENTHWYKDKHINTDIIIENTTLFIHAQVFFTPGAKIYVKQNSVLEISSTDLDNPARLTSGCNEFWGGIELWGDPTQPQNELHQGKVIIINGIIENAVCGIMTGNSEYTPEGGGYGEPYPVYPSGGIIEATQATFRNNKIGIEFYPYRDDVESNKSFLYGCTFLTNKELFNETIP
ncbi:MAG: hypothetical protein HQ542_00950, partial [Bacteroidia bacterium]|nr:hypothetical protein [Bacteroidia bacterium]